MLESSAAEDSGINMQSYITASGYLVERSV